MKKDLLVFIPTIGGGGAEKVTANIVNNLDQTKYSVTLLILKETSSQYVLDKQIKIKVLKGRNLKTALPKLVRYLKSNPPDLMMSHMSLSNILAVLARFLSKGNFPLILVEHSTLSIKYKNDKFSRKLIPYLMRLTYKYATKIISVSKEAAEDLKRVTKIESEKIIQIYNPIVGSDIKALKYEPIEHKWLNSNEYKVIIGVGRLDPVKNFQLLIKSFYAAHNKDNRLRLIILGEGKERKNLEELLIRLKITHLVELKGFVNNPYAYMYNSDLFVLSSNLEGLPTVIVESLACGLPVVSTDCPSGPKEILQNGKYGIIVPENNESELSNSILKQISEKHNKNILINRGMFFSIENSLTCYEKVIDALLNQKSGQLI